MEQHDDGFVVYSKTDCRFCELAKELLNEEGFGYEFVMCDNYLKEDRQGFLERMKVKIGHEYTTFPMVFYKGKFIGGYKELIGQVQKLECFN